MTEQEHTIQTRIAEVQTRIVRACEKAGRLPSEIMLLAVSKTKPVQDIREAWACGLRQFGENYVQEWQSKHQALSDLEQQGLQWHIIGHLQTNKCKYIAGKVALIHSVDSVALLHELEKRTPDGLQQPVLLQFNMGQEASKSGWQHLEDVQDIFSHPWRKVVIQGLMALPPYWEEAENVRPFFHQLFLWREQLQQTTGFPLPMLSMGMSHDLEVAIEEGSTCIRIGTAIFGERDSSV